MLVKDCLARKDHSLITVGPEVPVPQAMKLLISNRISCLPVLSGESRLIGIISDKDIFTHAFHDPAGFTKATVGDLMTTELIVGVADDSVDYIGSVMTKNRIRHVPIVENDRLIGLLSIGDVVKSQLSNMEVENRYLRQYIGDKYPG